jgi:NitT/TauT family transport system permease protein
MRLILPLLVGVVLLWLWYVLTLGEEASFRLAPPQAVVEDFFKLLLSGALFRHIGTTLIEIAVGFFIGVSCAFVCGYAVARSRMLEQAVGPYIVGFQAVPIVAIMPVLIQFFGPGLFTNSLICALIVFFPMLVSTIVGIRNVSPDLHDLMRSLSATHWQIFSRLEMPAALPVLFGGIKISVTLAVAGAVVGEALGADSGLGFLIYQSRYMYNTSRVLVGVFTLVVFAIILYQFVAAVEHRLLRWQRTHR